MNRIEITDEMLFKFVPQAELLLLEQIPPEHQLQHTFSKDFDRKMKLLIKREKSNPLIKAIVIKSKRIAIIFLLIIIVTFTTIMGVEALRARFFKVIMEIYRELTSFSFILDGEKSDVKFQMMEPEYIPAGFSKTDTDKQYTTVYITYTDKAGAEIIFEQNYITSNKVIIDTEDSKTEKLQINGYDVYYISGKGTNQLIWFDSEYAFSLMAPIDKGELIKMAESIKK